MLDVISVLMGVVVCVFSYFIRTKLKGAVTPPIEANQENPETIDQEEDNSPPEQQNHTREAEIQREPPNDQEVISVSPSKNKVVKRKPSTGEFTTKYLSQLYTNNEVNQREQKPKERKRVTRSHSLKLKLGNTVQVKEMMKEKDSSRLLRSFSTKRSSSIRLQNSVFIIETIPQDLFASSSFCVFGLETTSLYNNCQIMQISATTLDGYNSFTVNVAPNAYTGPLIVRKAERTAIQSRNRNFIGRSSLPLPITEALALFANWLSTQGEHIILLGHNIHSFDIKHLQRAIVDNQMKSYFGQLVGFVDTLPLMRFMYPGQPSYSLERLYRNVFGGEFEVHNARFEVTALSGMLCLSHVKQRDLWRFSKPIKWGGEMTIVDDKMRRKSCHQ